MSKNLIVKCHFVAYCFKIIKQNPIEILIVQCKKGDNFCFSLFFGFFSIFNSPLVCIFLGFPPSYKWEIEEQTQATGALSFVIKLLSAWQPSERQCGQPSAASQGRTALTSGTATLKPLCFNNS